MVLHLCFEWSLVLRSTLLGGASVVKRIANSLLVGGIATVIYSSQTVQVAHQDVASLVGKIGQDRWLAHIEAPIGETVALTTASMLGKEKVELESGKAPSTLSVSKETHQGSKPQRINRALKSGRVLQTTARQAPKSFSAGSVLERHSLMEQMDQGKKQVLAFVKPKPFKEAMQVAAVFHEKKKKQVGRLSKAFVPTYHKTILAFIYSTNSRL